MITTTARPSWPLSALHFAHLSRVFCGCVASLALIGHVHSANAQIPDRLKAVVSDNAPMIVHETGNADDNYRSINHLLRVDFDGDVLGANNASNANYFAAYVNLEPTVYYTIAETGSDAEHGAYYIGYYFYHPRDGGTWFSNGHEHDLEGIWVIAEKSAYYPSGRARLVLSEAHGALIPYGDRSLPGATDRRLPDVIANSAAFQGFINRWPNWDGSQHPVTIIRSGTHGTYMAQRCDGYPPYSTPDDYWDGFGVYPSSFTACIHTNSDAILYTPTAYPCGIDGACGPNGAVPSNVGGGTYQYTLADFASSPMWQERQYPNKMFTGDLQWIGAAQIGYQFFLGSDPNAREANPPWAWPGGTGECPYISWLVGDNTHGCWHRFAADNTHNHDPTMEWPTISPGALLTNPAGVGSAYFPFMAWESSVSFNSVLDGVPPPDVPPQASIAIDGPAYIYSNETPTWSAVMHAGVPPYTYQWSGAISGFHSSVSGSIPSDDVLYLDVWDATGAHFAVSTYISVSEPPPPPCDGGCTRRGSLARPQASPHSLSGQIADDKRVPLPGHK